MAPRYPELWTTAAATAPRGVSMMGRWLDAARIGLRTLKSRLTLAAMGSLVIGIGSVSVLSQHRVERDLMAQTREREVAQTARLAADLSQRAIALQQMLRSTAEQIDPTLERLDDALEQHLQAQPALRHEFSNLFVAAPDGRMRLVIDDAGPRRPQVSIADRDYFRAVLAEKRPVISGAVPGRVSGEPVIVFSHPIIRDGQVSSVIGGAIRLSSSSLAAFLLDRGNDVTQPELLAISDEHGQVLAHPTRDLLLKPLSQDAQLSTAVADWESRGAPVAPSGLILRQPDSIATAAGVAGTGWVVWRAMPESSLLGPLRTSRIETLRDACLAIVVLGLLTFWLVKVQLRPLRQLQDRALHLFDVGHDIHEGWPGEGGEIGSVAQVLRHVGAERAHLELFTHQLLGRLDSVMAAAPIGIGFTRNQHFELVSKAWCRLLLRDESELLGTPAKLIFASETDYDQLGQLVGAAFVQDGDYGGEWRFRRKDGSLFWGQLCGRPVDPGDPAAGTIWTLADVTHSRASRETLEWSATHDPLTGLANRAAFETRLRSVLGHAPAALLVIDLDRFKPINDAHGHAAGDAMLKQVAAALSSLVRAGDLVVRTGGDEFAVVLERCPADAAQRVAAEVQRAIARAELVWDGHTLGVGASVGVAPLSDGHASIEAWVADADSACYAAKAAGRGTVRLARGGQSNVIELPRVDQTG